MPINRIRSLEATAEKSFSRPKIRASSVGVAAITSLDLAAGVVVRVPAGVPHVIRPLGPVPLVYLVLKEKVGAR